MSASENNAEGAAEGAVETAKSATVYLALGANSGDKIGNLRRAVAELQSEAEVEIAARSKIYETQSVEGGGPEDFLNAALRVQTSLAPREFLRVLQRIESDLGRPQPPRKGPRVIDIDILIWDDQRIDWPDLQVPHPRMHARAFVLRPLLDILESGWLRASAETW